MRRALAAAALALLLAACGSNVRNPVTGQTERTVMDERAELAQGKQAHEEVLKEYARLEHPALQAYVTEVGLKLARASHRPELPWTFTVLDSPEVNAFALPGGYVYITRGIMAYLHSEADLAGVLGHEVGHVTARHGAQRATRAQNAGLGVLAATVLGAVLEAKGVGGATDLASGVAQNVAAGHVARYSREQELQADQLGAEYLAKVQYDPRNMVDVIQVLVDQDKFRADAARARGQPAPEGANWLSSHPASEQRLAQIMQRATAAAAARYNDEGRARYLRAIDGITFGDSREQGVVRGRHFFHEPLGIALSAPAGWLVMNDTEQVALMSPARDAALLMHLVPAKAGASHDEIIRNLLKPEQGRVERTTLGGGLAATRFAGTRLNSQGQRQNLEVTVVSGPAGRHYLLQFAARDAATLARQRPGLREAEASFRPLAPADRALAQPWTLRTVALPAGGWEALARQGPLGADGAAQLKLINGEYSSSAAARAARPGQLVKVVQGTAPPRD